MLFIGILVDVMRLNLSSQIRNNYYIIQKIFIFLFATILIVWMFPNKASFKFEFQKGKPWMHETLIAPYDFPVYKSNEQLLQEQENLRDKIKLTFVMDESAFEIKAEDLYQILNKNGQSIKMSQKTNDLHFLISIKKNKNKKRKTG